MRAVFFAVLLLAAVPACVQAQASRSADNDVLPLSFLQNVHPHTARAGSTADGGGVLGSRSNGSVLGVDSVVNWSSYFYEPGFDSNGNLQFTWPYTMVGNSPFGQGGEEDRGGGTTSIGAPVVPVNIDLRDQYGNPRYYNGKRLYMDATRYVEPVLDSPVFSNAFYTSSGRPTQFTDAIQRAEFIHTADEDWHTMLQPRAKTPRTMVLNKGTYQFALNADGSCCAYVLIDESTFINALFPATATDTSTVIGAAENAGDIHTRDISTFLFPNSFLYSGKNCCVIGFHTYDLEPGDATNGWRERRYVVNYSSRVSPGLFRDPTFTDIVALSHEMAETFNDPFVNNATPWWLAPNGNCQNNLETGDVIEGLPNAQFPPMVLNGRTWHPQNEALLQWFAGQTPSSAIHGAYSYPNTDVLTSAAKSQNFNCTP